MNNQSADLARAVEAPTDRPELSTKARRRINQIQIAACRLVIEHGYDGFTMDDLAEACDVSRRTLFNYVPDKASAVLGVMPPGEAAALQTFIAGGPTGNPLGDVVHVFTDIVSAKEKLPSDFEAHQLVNAAIAADPKVAALVSERFTALTKALTDAMCQRENWPEDDLRARTFSASFFALIKVTLEEMSANITPEFSAPDLVHTFHRVLDADRAVRALNRTSR